MGIEPQSVHRKYKEHCRRFCCTNMSQVGSTAFKHTDALSTAQHGAHLQVAPLVGWGAGPHRIQRHQQRSNSLITGAQAAPAARQEQ